VVVLSSPPEEQSCFSVFPRETSAAPPTRIPSTALQGRPAESSLAVQKNSLPCMVRTGGEDQLAHFFKVYLLECFQDRAFVH
jgi:hypothetical protein